MAARGRAVAGDGDHRAGRGDGHLGAPGARGLAEVVDVGLHRHGGAGVEGARGPAQIEPGRSRGRRPAQGGRAGGRQGDQGGVAVVRRGHRQTAGGGRAGSQDAAHLHRDVRLAVLARTLHARAARVLVAARAAAPERVGALGLAGGAVVAVALSGRRAPVSGPQGEHGCRHHRRDHRRRHRAGAQPVAAGRAVLRVHREAAAVEAGGGRDPRPGERGEGRAGRLQDRQLGGGDRGAGPAAGGRALGGAAAARAVVDVPDQFAAQRRGEDQPVVPGEVRDARAAAGLHHGERGAGALDLAGGRGEQIAGGGRCHAEDGGDLAGGEVVADGEFQGLALLGGGAGRLRPGEQGQIPAPLFLERRGEGGSGRLLSGRPAGAARRVRGVPPLFGLGQLAQARPAGQRVQPGPAVVVGGGDAVRAPLGQREGVAQGGGGRVVVAQDGQAVGEQAVQVRLVACRRAAGDGARGGPVARLTRPAGIGRPMSVTSVVCLARLGRLRTVAGFTRLARLSRPAVRPVRAGGAGGGLRAAAHHPCDRRPRRSVPSGALSCFNPYG
ncbi:hypothetical protein STEPF1_06023 [Streptomyces sp. F-1]|nr:hypothetical protein STEPF1_06023 [Streptomyces sp. F-1]